MSQAELIELVQKYVLSRFSSSCLGVGGTEEGGKKEILSAIKFVQDFVESDWLSSMSQSL